MVWIKCNISFNMSSGAQLQPLPTSKWPQPHVHGGSRWWRPPLPTCPPPSPTGGVSGTGLCTWTVHLAQTDWNVRPPMRIWQWAVPTGGKGLHGRLDGRVGRAVLPVNHSNCPDLPPGLAAFLIPRKADHLSFNVLQSVQCCLPGEEWNKKPCFFFIYIFYFSYLIGLHFFGTSVFPCLFRYGWLLEESEFPVTWMPLPFRFWSRKD